MCSIREGRAGISVCLVAVCRLFFRLLPLFWSLRHRALHTLDHTLPRYGAGKNVATLGASVVSKYTVGMCKNQTSGSRISRLAQEAAEDRVEQVKRNLKYVRWKHGSCPIRN